MATPDVNMWLKIEMEDTERDVLMMLDLKLMMIHECIKF